MTESALVRKAFSRAANRYREAATLQRVVCEHLLDLAPSLGTARRVLDLGCGTGFASGGLSGRYPGALQFAADFSSGMLDAHEAADRCVRVCADAQRLPFVDAAFDLVFSSLMLQWCNLSQALPECARVLVPGGCVCFSTVLDGTLGEIDAAFAAIDRHRHTVAFPDEGRLRDALAASGLVLDRVVRETRVEYFATARGVLQSNRDIGASRVPGGRSTLLGRAALQEVCRRLEALRVPDGLPLTYELAWVVAQRAGYNGGKG